jgi:hypothetical protein
MSFVNTSAAAHGGRDGAGDCRRRENAHRRGAGYPDARRIGPPRFNHAVAGLERDGHAARRDQPSERSRPGTAPPGASTAWPAWDRDPAHDARSVREFVRAGTKRPTSSLRRKEGIRVPSIGEWDWALPFTTFRWMKRVRSIVLRPRSYCGARAAQSPQRPTGADRRGLRRRPRHVGTCLAQRSPPRPTSVHRGEASGCEQHPGRGSRPTTLRRTYAPADLGSFAVNPASAGTLPFDPLRDFMITRSRFRRPHPDRQQRSASHR